MSAAVIYTHTMTNPPEVIEGVESLKESNGAILMLDKEGNVIAAAKEYLHVAIVS